ncbi:MAG: cation:proton antiporter [Candidatus Omnitrophota bacterium]
MYQFTEQHIFIFLVQIFLLLGSARVLGELFRRWKQPALTAEILVGIVFGPTIFGRLFPSMHAFIFPAHPFQQNMLETVMWLGLLFFLLETGLKMDFSSAWRHRGNAFKIAVTDIIVPMVLGFLVCLFLPAQYLARPDQRVLFAFFMATVMTISAMPITIRALTDLDLIKTDLGYLIMSALSVNEIVGWVIFTLIVGIFTQVNASISQVFFSLSLIIGVAFICLTAGRRLADFAICKIREHNIPEPGASLTFLCLLGCLCGAILQKTGIHALLGFFIAGIMAGEAKELPARTRQVISQMVYAIFVPLFFTGIGLRIDFFRNFNIFLVLFVTLIGILGKFTGAWIGVYAARLPKTNRLPVAIAHIPGGSMEIVMGIVALRYGFITEPVFEAIVFGAVASAVVLGPWLKFSLEKRKEVSALEFFSKSEIIASLKANNRDAAILELCAAACEKQNVPDMDTLYAAVLQRENMMGTAIEEGVAFPHARFDMLIKPVVVFARSHSGIEWDSPDGKPTHFIVLILTSKRNEESQLQILRIISQVMQQEKNRNRIMQAEDISGLWAIFQEVFVQENILKK